MVHNIGVSEELKRLFSNVTTEQTTALVQISRETRA